MSGRPPPSASARAGLERALGPDADLLKSLSDREAERLHALLEASRARQRAALREAQQHALRFVPALLRKPLLRLLGVS